jgi:hypothetical protein
VCTATSGLLVRCASTHGLEQAVAVVHSDKFPAEERSSIDKLGWLPIPDQARLAKMRASSEEERDMQRVPPVLACGTAFDSKSEGPGVATSRTFCLLPPGAMNRPSCQSLVEQFGISYLPSEVLELRRLQRVPAEPILVRFLPPSLAAYRARSARRRIELRSSSGRASVTPALKV